MTTHKDAVNKMDKFQIVSNTGTDINTNKAEKYPPISTISNGVEINKEKAYAMCMLMTVVSLIGFLVENTFVAITGGYIDNRNMFLPFLLGYGISIFVIYLIFGTPSSPRLCSIDLSSKNKLLNVAIYFMLAFSIVCIGECILGSFVEMTLGIVWWDYSDIPLNMTKYTSVPTSAAFAAMITLFMGCIFKPLYNVFRKMNKKLLYPLATVFMILLVADFIHSGLVMMNTGDIMHIWRIDF